MPDRRRGLCAVAVLLAVAASAAYLSPASPPVQPWVPPVPGGPGLGGSLLMLLPAVGFVRFVWRFGRAPMFGSRRGGGR